MRRRRRERDGDRASTGGPELICLKNTGLKTETELGVCSKKHLGNSVSSRGAPPSGGRGWVSLPPGWPGAVSAVDSGLCTHHQVGMATHTPVPRLLLLLALLAPHRIQPTVFLPASKASEVLARWKRAGSYLLEELFQGNLEKECYEEICVYEEAREVFEHDAPTAEFWKMYMGGSPCISQPCLNNGSCQDSIRSYTCTCAPGYEGRDCAFSKNECHPSRTDGCQHFCHPGPESYTCSCAEGHTLGPDHRSCLPHESCACGTLMPQRSKQELQVFPWQVKLANSEGKDFCGGVIIKENVVLTTAGCSLRYRNISVRASLRRAPEDAPVAVAAMHVHERYDAETGDNDLALLALARPLRCPDAARPVCAPEADFAEQVLVPRARGLLSGWTLPGPRLGLAPAQLPIEPMDAEECGRTLNVTVTTRMSCEQGVAAGAAQWVAGSAVSRRRGGTWFLTGLLHTGPPAGPGQPLLVTKVPRYSLWLRRVMQQLSPVNPRQPHLHNSSLG
ncbi:vitamin K-dependent protein Z isoform X2 [Camelus ferus]|uniref:Vitamin K-dependent protein Z isoform X2 n=1 Tax=Camelus ferus TaxID=419612 RepID=A0A8B8UED4_CAMFR|nr:vitamin K-dependent protein Z isoform X2 [Camelus ferus]